MLKGLRETWRPFKFLITLCFASKAMRTFPLLYQKSFFHFYPVGLKIRGVTQFFQNCLFFC